VRDGIVAAVAGLRRRKAKETDGKGTTGGRRRNGGGGEGRDEEKREVVAEGEERGLTAERCAAAQWGKLIAEIWVQCKRVARLGVDWGVYEKRYDSPAQP